MLGVFKELRVTDHHHIDVIYLDNHLLVLRKPAGMLVQGDSTGDPSLLEWGRQFLKVQFDKPGNVFLALVHRLDRPTSGVVVFGRTSKAAARLSEQFRQRQIRKIYWALVEGKTPEEGHLRDRVARYGVRSQVVQGNRGKIAELHYRRLRYAAGISWVEIEMATGRHHQIRVQFQHAGYPLVGDLRYGATRRLSTPKALALHARSITLTHPTRQEQMTFHADPDAHWFSLFRELP
ncbi:MAG: RluA family pseudouridine synthase [Gemmatimonadetes bacterium]|nr:MAG: RluA family pseudouridine synthase [Gemmatimonadota bacterium]